VKKSLFLIIAWTSVLTLFAATGACLAELKEQNALPPVAPPFPETDPLTLQKAIERALEQNHELQAVKNTVAASQEDVRIASSYLLPKISLEERFMRTNNPTYGFMAKLNQQRFSQDDFAIEALNNPAPISDFQTSISLEMPLFMPTININRTMAKVEHAAKTLDYHRKMEEIALQVAEAYLSVISAGKYVEVSQKALQDAREHERIARLSYDNEMGLYSDILRATTAVTEAEQQQVSAQKNYAIAKRGLSLLLGSDDPIEIRGETPVIPLRDLDAYLEASITRNDIKALEKRHVNTMNNLKLAKADFLPDIGIGTSYQMNDHESPLGGDGDSWQIMGQVKWIFFEGNRISHATAKARHQSVEAEQYLAGLKKAVSYKVHEAYLSAQEAAKNLDLANAALATAEEGKRLVFMRYENSLTPLVDLLDAQTNLDHSRAKAVHFANEYTFSLIRLGYESGTILNDLEINTALQMEENT
jgi:outer membrane protein TolC